MSSLVPAKCSQTRVKMPSLFSEVGEAVSMREKLLHIPASFHGGLMGMAPLPPKHTGQMPQWFSFSLPTTTQLYLAAKMHTHSILDTSFSATVAKSSLR